MNKKDSVYVTGHQHPDADSVASAIAYAFFKRSMGIHAIPCCLGSMNAETKYLLQRFGFPEPLLLTDARVRLSEIKMDPPDVIHPDATVYEALQNMQKSGRAYCGVADEDGKLLGLVTKSDIAVIGLGDTAESIQILSRTTAEQFCRTISGTMVYEDERLHINGKVSIVVMTTPEKLANYEVQDRIVIVGNDSGAQRSLIEHGAGLLIVVWAEKIQEDVLEAARAHHCPVIISGHGGMNTARYLYFAPPVKYIMKTKLVTFRDHELAEDAGNKMMQSRYRIYPVTDQEGHVTGYAARYHIMNAENRKLILVDHNEFSQSVRAVEKARVLEVIDHHRINDFSTMYPVSFRNETVGSTATIVATIFRENQIPIPGNLAGLLLGALLSDTMNFHSPTATEKDRSTANILAAVADIDIETFAKELFEVSSNTDGISLADMINQDRKVYDIHSCKLSISQVMVSSVRQIQNDPLSIQQALETFADKKQLDLTVLVFTSVLENGSVVYSGGDRAAWALEAFPNQEQEEHSVQKGVLSRKQQILPMLTEVIMRYM